MGPLRSLVVACGCALIASVLLAPAASGAQTYMADCSIYGPVVAPSSWSPGCVGASAFYDNLTWTSWGGETSEANGDVGLNDCDPDCARGTTYRYPARLVAFRLQPCLTEPGSLQYTRVEASELFPEENPFGQSAGWRSAVWKIDSVACTARLAVFEQGEGVVLAERPHHIDARRSIRPTTLSGLDTWVIRKWRSFGGPRAVASAVYWWHTPDGSGFRRFSSRVVLDRLGKCGSGFVYTRIRGRFLHAKPPKMGRVVEKTPYLYEYC